MDSGRARKFFYLKLAICLLWVVYLFLCQTRLSLILPLNQVMDFNLKKRVPKNSDLVLIGGSNVSVGLSAKKISEKFKCVNLGLFGECQGFDKYVAWLGDTLSSNFIIYSPADIWLSDFNKGPVQVRSNIPPIIVQFKALWSLLYRPNLYYDEYGDSMIEYPTYEVHSFSTNSRISFKKDSLIVFEIINRVKTLKKFYGSSKVFIRIPPIYVNSQNENLLRIIAKNRVCLLKSYGLDVLGGTLTSKDFSLFKDDLHPSQKGRDYFTSELVGLFSEYVKK